MRSVNRLTLCKESADIKKHIVFLKFTASFPVSILLHLNNVICDPFPDFFRAFGESVATTSQMLSMLSSIKALNASAWTGSANT